MSAANLLTDDRTRGFTNDEILETRYSSFAVDKLESPGMAYNSILSGSRVLDVGCGTGNFAEALKNEKGCNIVGVEPHGGRAALARQRGLRVITGYLTEELLATEEPFDVIVFIDVLEHVPDPVELLRIVSSKLLPGGKVVISVPNVAHWTVRWALLFGRFDYQPIGIMDATHLRWFTEKTIASVVTASGLRVATQDVSRGTWLDVYTKNWLIRRIPQRVRRALLDRLCRLWPGLFGCQHFVEAVRP